MKKAILTYAAVAAVTGAAVYVFDIFFLVLFAAFVIVAGSIQSKA